MGGDVLLQVGRTRITRIHRLDPSSHRVRVRRAFMARVRQDRGESGSPARVDDRMQGLSSVDLIQCGAQDEGSTSGSIVYLYELVRPEPWRRPSRCPAPGRRQVLLARTTVKRRVGA